MKYILILCLLLPFTTYSQNKYSFGFDGDVRISNVIEGDNGLLLLSGKYGFEKNEADFNQAFLPFLYTFNKSTLDTNNLLAQWAVNNGFVVDVIPTKSGNWKGLINLFDNEQDTADFALIDLSSSLTITGIETFKSQNFQSTNKIYSQGIFELESGEIVVTGSLYKDWARSNYLAIKGLDGIWREDTVGREYYFQYSGLNGTDDLLETDNSFVVFSENVPLSLRPQWYSKDSLTTNSMLHFVKDDSNYVRRNDYQSNSISNYSIYGINQISELDADFFLSSCQYHKSEIKTEWVSPDTILVHEFDTIDFALYFFNQKLDSLKLISLTEEFSYPFNGPGAVTTLNDDRICVGVTLNNFYSKNPDLLLTHFYNDTINEYPVQKENKILVALLDEGGNNLWSKVLDSGNKFEMITDAIATKNGGCILAGTTFDPENNNLHDPIILILDSIGFEDIRNLNNNELLTIYPNPAKSRGKVNLSWIGMQKQNWQVKFYDKQGRLVHATKISQGVSETNIQLPELPSGNYIIRAEGSGKQVHTGTLVVE